MSWPGSMQTISRHGWSKVMYGATWPSRPGALWRSEARGGLAGEVAPGDEHTYIPVVERPDDIMIIAAGGEEGAMSAVIPSWGPKVSSTAVTWPVAS